MKRMPVREFVRLVQDLDVMLGYCVQAQNAQGSSVYREVMKEAVRTPLGGSLSDENDIKKEGLI